MATKAKGTRKPTIRDRVTRERGQSRLFNEEPAATAETSKNNLAPAIDKVIEAAKREMEETPSSATDMFTLSHQERTVLHKVTNELDRAIKAARRASVNVEEPVMNWDLRRSRCAFIKHQVTAAGREQQIEFKAPLRREIGAGLSLRARWYKREQERLEERNTDAHDVTKSLDFVKGLARKFGAQLLLELPEDKDDRDDEVDGEEL